MTKINDPYFFQDPAIEAHWEVDMDDDEDKVQRCKMLLEAARLDASIIDLKSFSQSWDISSDDLVTMMMYVKPTDDLRRGLDRFLDEVMDMPKEKFFGKMVKRQNSLMKKKGNKK